MTGRYQKSALPDGITPESVQKFGEGLGAPAPASSSQTGQSKQGSNTSPETQQSSDAPAAAPDEKEPAAAAAEQPTAVDAKKTPSTPKYPDIVLDIFKAIRALEDYDQIKKSCNEVESGIAVPVTIFAKHGLPASKVLQILEENKLIVEISSTRKSLILQKAARGLLFG